jgi:outer membrane protein TolC
VGRGPAAHTLRTFSDAAQDAENRRAYRRAVFAWRNPYLLSSIAPTPVRWVRSVLALRAPAVALWLAIATMAARAEPTADITRMTFDAAVGLAESHPVVGAPRAALGARESGDRELTALQFNPSFYVAPGIRFTPDEQRGFEFQAGLYQSWNLAGLGSAQKTTAQAERRVLGAESRAVALEQRLAAASAWLVLAGASESVGLAQSELTYSEDFARVVKKARDAGVLTSVDLAEAEANVAAARNTLIAVEGEVVHAASLLAASTGTAAGTQIVVAGPAPRPVLPEAAAWPGLVATATSLPRVTQSRLAALANGAHAAELEKQASGSFDTGLLMQRESPNSYLALVSIGAELPLFARNQRSRSQTLSYAARDDEDARRAALEAGHVVQLSLHEVEHTRGAEANLANELVPALERLVDAHERGLKAGESEVMPLLFARRRLVEARRQLVATRTLRVWAEVKAWLYVQAIDGAPQADDAEGVGP